MYLMLALGLVTLIMAYLGYHLSITPAESRRAKFVYRASFVACGIISLVLIGMQGHQADESQKRADAAQQRADSAQRRADASQARLADSMDRLGTQTGEIQRSEGEIKRVQGLNTDLQNKLVNQSGELIDASKRITDLSKQAIDVSTGGEGYCFLYLSEQFTPPGIVTLVFLREGDSSEKTRRPPLYDVTARIMDLQVFDDMIAAGRGNMVSASDLIVPVGNLAPTSALMTDKRMAISDVPRHDYRVFFNARNGWWTQDLQLRKLGKNWSQAIRVFGRVGNKEQLVYTSVPKDFPGGPNPDWHK